PPIFHSFPTRRSSDLKQNRWISQAVVIGDRRPYLVALITIDPEEIGAFAEQHGVGADAVIGSDEMRAEVQKAVDDVNAKVGRVRSEEHTSELQSLAYL